MECHIKYSCRKPSNQLEHQDWSGPVALGAKDVCSNQLTMSVLPRLDHHKLQPNDSPAQFVGADISLLILRTYWHSLYLLFSTSRARTLYQLHNGRERARKHDLGTGIRRDHAITKQQWRKHTRKSSSMSHSRRNMLRMSKSTDRRS